MRDRCIYGAFLLLALVASAHAQSKEKKLTKQQEELKRLDSAWMIRPYFTNDMRDFDQIVADDFTITHSNGDVLTKAEKRANIIDSHITNPSSPFRLIESKVRIYGNTAISYGSLNEAKSIVTFTNTYVRQNGRWRVVATHLNRRPKPSTDE